MTNNEVISWAFLITAVIHTVWAVSACIRAMKGQPRFGWPVPGAWVITFYTTGKALLFWDLTRFRFGFFQSDDTSNLWVTSVRVFAALMTIWVFARWLPGRFTAKTPEEGEPWHPTEHR